MISSVTKRRLWVVAAVTAISGFLCLSLWWNYRPLNATERVLVRNWKVPDPHVRPGEADLTLNADRTFVIDDGLTEFLGVQSGTWTADSDHVFLRYQPRDSDLWERLMFHARNIWETGPQSPQYTIRWHDESGERVPVRLADVKEEARISRWRKEWAEKSARERLSPPVDSGTEIVR